ncbi:GGDEF domain-containing protein [Xanthobacter sp. KR7-225]|uniref:GGDEF domain-containing protein n=1 Tax=Xanthobacter sp. KR7-225 TaxID=3156613 RepID=UPI0032B4E695
MMSEGGIYLYTGPAFALIVAATFFGAWLSQRQRGYVLLFAITFLAFALASLSQMLRLPYDYGSNAMVSAILYTFAILALVEGVMLRRGAVGVDAVLVGLAGAIIVLLYYYYFFDRDLIMRIYIQNFGYGIMIVFASIKLARLSNPKIIDQIILVLLILFGLHFFPRTLLTMNSSEVIREYVRAGLDNAPALARALRTSMFWQVLNFTLLISAFLMAMALLAAVAMDVIEDLSREGGIDALTGLANRRGFHRRSKGLRPDGPLAPVSVVYCDIDRFKAINDTYGHPVGDRVLQHFARLAEQEVRAEDVLSRIGGEEFVMLLARANRAGAAQLAERLRSETELTRFPGLPAGATVTASFGVAQWRPDEELTEAMQRADSLVYAAKRAGRNRVAVEAAEADPAPADPTGEASEGGAD